MDPWGLATIDGYGSIVIGDDEIALEGRSAIVEILNVPVQDQLSVENGCNLCWATCASMIMSYYRNENVDRIIDIAIAVAKLDERYDPESSKYDPTYDPYNAFYYNVPREWYSTDYLEKLLDLDAQSAHQIQIYPDTRLAEQEIIEEINSKDPIALLYGEGYDEYGTWLGNGHWCITTGYVQVGGDDTYFLRTDPYGGIQSLLSYQELNNDYERKWYETAIRYD